MQVAFYNMNECDSATDTPPTPEQRYDHEKSTLVVACLLCYIPDDDYCAISTISYRVPAGDKSEVEFSAYHAL